MRRRRVEARREALAEIVGGYFLLPRGIGTALAAHFGVSPSTISRDLRLILYGGQTCNIYSGDALICTIVREYAGGRVISITDGEDNEIRGPERRRILRFLPRYFGRK